MARTPWSVRSVAAMLAIAGPVGAQSVGGVVRDSAGLPIANALVSIEALSRSTTTDSAGHYSLLAAAGLRLMQVRRVGFTGASRMVLVKEGATADFVLARVVVTLDTVRRIEQYKPTDLPMMEFLENRKMGLGHFVSRSTLDSMHDRPLLEAFDNMKGLVIVRQGSVNGWVAGSRIRSLTKTCVDLEGKDRGVALTPRADADCFYCFPDVYLDFTLLSRVTTKGMIEVPNINRFNTEQLEAIEVYSSPAELPARYGGSRSQCGVIVFHALREKAK